MSMFNKNDQEAMKKAAGAQRRPGTGIPGEDDLSAYDGRKPGVSREPMTEDDIKFTTTQVPGSEPARDEMEGDFNTPPPGWGQNYHPAGGVMPPRPEMPYEDTDAEMFPGGPTMTEFMAWQKQFPDMYIVDDLPDGNIYIYRTLTRYEYKVLQSLPNTDPLQREELIIDKCLLYPIITYEDMSNAMAGIISTLAQHVLTSSGFVKDSIPRKL
jgi:hypothetical protein